MLVNMLSAGGQIRREVKMGYEIVYGRAQLFRVNEFVSDTRDEAGPDTGKNGVRPGLFSREGRSGLRFRPLCFTG